MSYKIEITQDEIAEPLYVQRVEELNLKAILAAVNTPIPQPRAPRADRGVARGPRADTQKTEAGKA